MSFYVSTNMFIKKVFKSDMDFLFFPPAKFKLRRVPISSLGLAVDGAGLLDALRVVGRLLPVTGESRLKTRSGALGKNIIFLDCCAKVKASPPEITLDP